MSNEKLIARAEASLEGVSPAPWYPEMDDEEVTDSEGDALVVAIHAQEDDLFFIASARQDVPDLIAALRAEREARDHANACNRGLVRLNEALQIRAERAEAMVAAAYQDAADKVFNPSWKPKCQSDWVLARTAGDVRKSTPADASAALDRIRQEAADEALEQASNTPDYDCVMINDYGGGNVDWWMDYIRAEIGRANDHWRDTILALKGGAK